MVVCYHKTICVDFGSERHYQECLAQESEFKAHLQKAYQAHPELFPVGMEQGWRLYGYTDVSKKRDGS